MEKIKEIRQNIHESIYELVSQISKLNIALENSRNSDKCTYISNMGKEGPSTISDVNTIQKKLKFCCLMLHVCIIIYRNMLKIYWHYGVIMVYASATIDQMNTT